MVSCRNLFNRNLNELIMANHVTKDTIIMDVLRMDPGTADFFLQIGMHCLGCPSSSGESIEQACMAVSYTHLVSAAEVEPLHLL